MGFIARITQTAFRVFLVAVGLALAHISAAQDVQSDTHLVINIDPDIGDDVVEFFDGPITKTYQFTDDNSRSNCTDSVAVTLTITSTVDGPVWFFGADGTYTMVSSGNCSGRSAVELIIEYDVLASGGGFVTHARGGWGILGYEPFVQIDDLRKIGEEVFVQFDLDDDRTISDCPEALDGPCATGLQVSADTLEHPYFEFRIFSDNLRRPEDSSMSRSVSFAIDMRGRFRPEGTPLNVGRKHDRLVDLHPIYPNPVFQRATIPFSLRSPADVRISVFDLMGREVSLVVDRHFIAGEHELSFDVTELSQGVYFVRQSVGDAVSTRQMIVGS